MSRIFTDEIGSVWLHEDGMLVVTVVDDMTLYPYATHLVIIETPKRSASVYTSTANPNRAGQIIPLTPTSWPDLWRKIGKIPSG